MNRHVQDGRDYDSTEMHSWADAIIEHLPMFRQATIQLTEAVATWQKELVEPYPFVYKGMNIVSSVVPAPLNHHDRDRQFDTRHPYSS